MIITHFQLHFQIKSELRMSIKTNKQTSFLKYNMNAELKAILETYRVSFCFYVSITPLETKKLQAWRVDQRKMHHVQRLHEKVRSQGLHVCLSTPFPTQLSLSPISMSQILVFLFLEVLTVPSLSVSWSTPWAYLTPPSRRSSASLSPSKAVSGHWIELSSVERIWTSRSWLSIKQTSTTSLYAPKVAYHINPRWTKSIPLLVSRVEILPLDNSVLIWYIIIDSKWYGSAL